MKSIINRRKKLKKKFKNKERVFGAWTSLAHSGITEIFCQSGVDFVGIDIEHSTISQGEARRIISAAQAGGSLCLPRIASHNMEMVKRLLDSGADGIIVPMVSTAEEVRDIISWLKYPPKGNRSYGIARGQDYGFDFENYTSSWNDTSTLIVQIESVEGVENIEAITAFEEVDGIMIGPYDLSGSLGIPGQLNHPKVQDACIKALQMAHVAQKSCGTQLIEPNAENMKASFDHGYDFVILASDVFLLWKWSEAMKVFIKQLRGTQ